MNKQTFITALLVAALALTACTTQKEEEPQPLDDVMMQAFYWDVPVDEQAKDGSWWDHLREIAPELKAAGISSLWTPVPAKGNWGIVDSGYGIYDHYDLGNYDQKGTVETRYGSRAELEQMRGEPYPESDIRWADSVAHTRTHLFFPKHTGEGEPNYEWHYGHFHPSSDGDSLTDFTDDVLRPRTKFFGNDLDTYCEEVQQRLCDWGKWLKGTVGFDGFRLDFVRGLQPEFVSRWVKGLPLQDGQQPFIVGEYWAADGRYIKEWVDSVAAGGADVHAFDFPLKFTLTDMCNKSGDEFDMSQLAHAGMIRNSDGFVMPAGNVVTFVDNHDTGKEHDKWLTKDFAMAYAYILTHEGTPCVFYPHYFAVTQHDVDDKSLEVTAPADLQLAIRQLIDIRRQYLGGTLTVLTETGRPEPSDITRHVYVARRQGNGTKDGAIIMLNNHDTDTLSVTLTVDADGFTDWTGQALVNLLDSKQVATVSSDGRATLSAPNRGYSIWVLKRDAPSISGIKFPTEIYR